MASGLFIAKDERRNLLLQAPIYKIIPRMAIPTIISMMITSMYSLADTYFVSSLGTAATAAVGVNFSLDNIIMTAGSFLAVGANSYIARLLGARQDHKASQVLSTAFFTAIMTGSTVMILGFIFMEPLVKLLGATGDVVAYSKDYASYILFAAPFMASNFVMNQCLRSEGSAAYSMIGIVSGAILNIALDPLFIFVFGWGIKGAAAATAISKFVSFAILITPYLRHSSLLRLSLRNVKYARDIVVEVTKMGSPTLIRIGLVATSTIILNNLAGQFSESALAGISVSNRVMMLMNSVVLGFGQGYQPVAGFNWGAKRFDRVRSAFVFSSISGVIAATALGVILAVFTRQVMQLFTTADEEMLAIGLLCIRLQCLTLPIHAWVIIVNMSYASLGKARGSAILSLSRQGICFIPMILLLPRLFGVNGLAAAQAAADVLSLLIALPLCVSLLREVRLLMIEQEKNRQQTQPKQPSAAGTVP